MLSQNCQKLLLLFFNLSPKVLSPKGERTVCVEERFHSYQYLISILILPFAMQVYGILMLLLRKRSSTTFIFVQSHQQDIANLNALLVLDLSEFQEVSDKALFLTRKLSTMVDIL